MDKETALKLGLAAFVIFIVFFVTCPSTKAERYDEYFEDDEGFEDEDFRVEDD
jgi:hypothetical protein